MRMFESWRNQSSEPSVDDGPQRLSSLRLAHFVLLLLLGSGRLGAGEFALTRHCVPAGGSETVILIGRVVTVATKPGLPSGDLGVTHWIVSAGTRFRTGIACLIAGLTSSIHSVTLKHHEKT